MFLSERLDIEDTGRQAYAICPYVFVRANSTGMMRDGVFTYSSAVSIYSSHGTNVGVPFNNRLSAGRLIHISSAIAPVNAPNLANTLPYRAILAIAER